MKKIDFYFDFLSPYSYLAWQWVRKNWETYAFRCFPVVLGKIIHHYETKGPAEIAPKRNYLFKNCLRYTRLNGISFVAPKVLPFNSLDALRMALMENAKDKQFAVIDRLFNASWGQGEDISDNDFAIALLEQNELSGRVLFECAQSKESRQALKRNIAQALEQGVFGLPSFVVDGELFWGNDSIPHMLLFMEGRDPMDHQAYQQFLTDYSF